MEDSDLIQLLHQIQDRFQILSNTENEVPFLYHCYSEFVREIQIMDPANIPSYIQEEIAQAPIFRFDSMRLDKANFNHFPSGLSDDVVRQTLLSILLNHACLGCSAGRCQSCCLCLIRVALFRYPVRCLDRGIKRDIIVGTNRTNGHATQPFGIVDLSTTRLHFNDLVTDEPLFGTVKS
jgi:hypothetical protein